MKKNKGSSLAFGVLMFCLSLGMFESVIKAEEYEGGPVNVIYDFVGHYALNYTGNTNHYDYWDATGTSKIVSKNYKDRSDISSLNNSIATITKTDSDSTIKAAYLIWQSREETAPETAIRFLAPSGAWGNITAEWVCQDSRTNTVGESYVAVYTMAAEVTDIVCSDAGGYGTYTVANIPVWEGVKDGVACGGESVASWQLVVVEESPNFPLRTISLNILSQYFFNVNYRVKVNFADASAPNGVISAQFLDGEINVDCPLLYDGMGYLDDYNYEYNGNYYRYLTLMRGLYKNGVCFNNRDTGTLNQTGSSAVGATRVHLYDDNRRENSAGSQELTYAFEGTNWGTNVFMFGVSIDIFAYDIVFDGNGADSGNMEKLLCIYGREYTLPESQYNKAYYKFDGWNTKPDGSGTTYKNRALVCNLTDTEDKVILYAQWIPDAYKITLDNQQAIISGTKAYYEWYGYGNYETEFCVDEISKIKIPEKKGYLFDGYYTQEDGKGKQYIDPTGNILSTPTTFTSDTTLYANWISGVYEIILDNQGADKQGTTKYYEKFAVGNYETVDCTTKITQIELPTKEHYDFSGYYTEKEGAGTRVIDARGNIIPAYTLFSEDTTIYAKWEPKNYVVSLDGQNATENGTTAYFEKYGVMNYVVEGKTDPNIEKVVEHFDYTGSEQVFVVPHTGTYELAVFGASGEGAGDEAGNFRSLVTGSVTLTEGEVLYIYVGGEGIDGKGGFNGGGDSAKMIRWTNASLDVTAGGGATDIRRGSMELADRIIVAAGGGGCAYFQQNTGTSRVYKTQTWGLAATHAVILNEFHSSLGMYNCNFEGANQENAGNYSAGDVLAVKTDAKTGEEYEVIISMMHKGNFGKGGYGGGGGWYGGGSANVKSVSQVDGSAYFALVRPTYGSCYIDGVVDGVIWEYSFTWESVVGADYRYSSGAYNNYYYDSEGSIVNCTTGHGYATIAYNHYLETSQMAATSITIPKKNGYVFGGYYTKKNGEGTQYIDESGNILSTPTTFTKDTILYAYWILTDTETYQIAFHGNGADDGTMRIMTCEFEVDYVLNKNQFTKLGYTFLGWSLTLDGVVEYKDEEIVRNLSDVKGDVITLYAQWMPLTYDVQFIANGGNGIMEDISLSYDVSQKLPMNQFEKRNEYGPSTFLGWNLQADATAAIYNDEAEIVNITGWESGKVTLYAIWDDCPWIIAEDLYYTLSEAQNGFITYEELMNQATAVDREDGSFFMHGYDEDKRTSFRILDYLPTDFTQFNSSGSVTETYEAIDSSGNIFQKRITVYVIDTRTVELLPVGTTRFINEKYYYESYENGGLKGNSIWKTDSEYIEILEQAFDNRNTDTPMMSFQIPYEKVVQIKDYIKLNGFGNSKNSNALQKFYDEFLISAHTN